ncbi:MAG: family 10 glycosylhydrolase [Candidatus Sericytochromatia bacterium]|nr:family 10 glycosylhydrolase [Candidatus Sericytochromatia bacterium]
MTRAFAGALLAAVALTGSVQAQIQSEPPIETGQEPPEVMREFRGMWVASVTNIDWPSKPGLSADAQKAELQTLLDQAVRLKLNAVILQVRPACDALYDSSLEPWSDYLTGRQGVPPEPFYDPLAYAVEQAHSRGLELHAWFNPYRARLLDGTPSKAAGNHVSVKHPEWVRKYGRFLWLDPGEDAVQDHSLAVMMDVVKRYDVDAVHLDDYFYPYREPVIGLDGKPARDATGRALHVPFPDEKTFAVYQAGGGTLSRDDWRRDNVNRFIKRLYRSIKLEKPHVKLGISPFGIWKPGHPLQVKGMNQYEFIYADARLWLMRGWLDYFAPQLYWSIENPDQSFPILLKWWVEQNEQKRHVWPGLFTSRVRETGDRGFNARQIAFQILWARLQKGASGHIHFSARALGDPSGAMNQLLQKEVYTSSALIPASPWLAGKPPSMPRLTMSKNLLRQELNVTLQAREGTEPRLWTVYARRGGRWSTEVVPINRTAFSYSLEGPQAIEALQVAGVDRLGQEGPRARIVMARDREKLADGISKPQMSPR